MKVLMFGWEFPPHISGGLGTACYGLTQSLLNYKVKLLFVVPRLFGDETGRDSFLIDASTVARKSNKKREGSSTVSVVRRASSTSATKVGITGDAAMTRIEVRSELKPYNYPVDMLLANRMIALRSWNYSMVSQGTAQDQDTEESQAIKYRSHPENVNERYLFSGTYGPNLLDEVHHYADVALAIANKHSFDVIHVHDWMTFPAGIAAKRASKKPLVVHVHSTEFDRSGERINETVFQLEKLGFAQADKIIAVSNWTKEIIISRYKTPCEKITVVHNGILPREQVSDFPFPDIGSHFVTFLGRITHQKGPGFFVEAAQKVLQEFPDVHFIVAGAGDLLPQTIERVAQLNMSANFHFTGFLTGTQVDQIWSLTDVYVMPSVSEPFGIAPLEAIQGGVPVILSRQSGVSEVMPHAIKVDFWDVKALAAAICSVLRYESLSHALRQNSKKHIKHLTWDKAAADVKAVYHELSGKK
jgi:glycogen synthase